MSGNDKPISPPSGKLGVLLPGMGAVSSTLVAGIELYKRGLGQLVGSLTQNQSIRLGKRYEGRFCPIREFVPLAEPEDLVFGGWDIRDDSLFQGAITAGVLAREQLEPVREALEAVQPMAGIYDHRYLHNLEGTHVKQGATKMELAHQVMDDIEAFRERHGLDRLVMIWCGSTEILPEASPVHGSLEALERGLADSAPEIPPSMIYAYAAIKLGIPYANGAPNLNGDTPALLELAGETGTPIAGKDF